jgi:hypothetical protein
MRVSCLPMAALINITAVEAMIFTLSSICSTASIYA